MVEALLVRVVLSKNPFRFALDMGIALKSIALHHIATETPRLRDHRCAIGGVGANFFEIGTIFVLRSEGPRIPELENSTTMRPLIQTTTKMICTQSVGRMWRGAAWLERLLAVILMHMLFGESLAYSTCRSQYSLLLNTPVST